MVDPALAVSGGVGMFKTNNLLVLLVHELVGKTTLGVLGEGRPPRPPNSGGSFGGRRVLSVG